MVINMKNEAQLDESISKLWKNPIYDGIVDIKKYKKSKFKILWILKEANNGGPGGNWNLRHFHDNVSVYPKWRKTYQKIIYTSFGILNSIEKFRDLPSIDSNSKIDGQNVLENLAIINIKKNGGYSSSDQNVINKNYELHKDFINQQIELINPDVIINASRVWAVFYNYCGDNFKNIKQFQYGLSNEKLIINAYHPNARYGDAKYYKNIMEVFLSWKMTYRYT